MSLQVALAGLGAWSRTAIMPALMAQPEAELAAVVDPDPRSLAEGAAAAPQAFAGSCLRQAIEARGPFDLVAIATPDDTHPALAHEALAHGAAVFCEKPLANDVAAARGLAEAARTAGLPATVGYSFRYSPAVQCLRRDLAAGRIGVPWLIELAEHNPQFHPHAGKALNWKGDPAHACAGALFEYGSHVVDLALWLMGPVEGVAAMTAQVLPGARLDDIATLQLRFRAAPAIGTLVASWAMAGGFPGIRIRVHGSEAVAEVELDHRLEGGQRYRVGSPVAEALADEPLEPLLDTRNDATRRHVADLVAIRLGRAPRHAATLPDFAAGTVVQEVLEQALRSLPPPAEPA